MEKRVNEEYRRILARWVPEGNPNLEQESAAEAEAINAIVAAEQIPWICTIAGNERQGEASEFEASLPGGYIARKTVSGGGYYAAGKVDITLLLGEEVVAAGEYQF